MAVIDDLLADVPEALRLRLGAEVGRLREPSRFGLQFERHIPEYLAVPGTRLRTGVRVALRDAPMSDTFIVRKLDGEEASLIRESDGTASQQRRGQIVPIKRFGEAVFPALRHVESVVRDPGRAHHVLIEGENHSVLELLDWTTQGCVDCIYIDPPYNTGATSWMYNNKIVDKSDLFRSSKWLSMMERRLRIAKRLLKKDGILVIAIDDYEYANLRVLLTSEKLFKGYSIDVVIVQHNPRGGGGTHVSSTHEYAVFVIPPGRSLAPIAKGTDELRDYRRRGRGDNNLRTGRPNSFFAIHVDPETNRVVGVGPPLEIDERYDTGSTLDGLLRVYPLGNEQEHGTGRLERVWRNSRTAVQKRLEDGTLTLRCTRNGTIVQVIGGEDKATPVRSIWAGPSYNAGEQGSNLVKALTGADFPYPKSIYTVLDCLKAAIGQRKDALVLDFFGGSGTTVHATELLNQADGGMRQCILVTNNEVGGDTAKALRASGHVPGDPEWEAKGICRSVTFPRLKAALLGVRGDGQPASWQVSLGETQEMERAVKVVTMPFLSMTSVMEPKVRRSLAEFVGMTADALEGAWPFHVPPSDGIRDPRRGQAILFDPNAADEFIEALAEVEGLSRVLLASTGDAKRDSRLKTAVQAAAVSSVIEKPRFRDAADGLSANLSYLRMTYLDPDAVEVKRCLDDLLPTLWLMCGGRGAVPTAAGGADMLIPEGARFGLLAEPSAFPQFHAALSGRPEVDYVFIVEDSPDGFLEMSRKLPGRIPLRNRMRLYRAYLDNFQINAGDR